MRFRYFRANAFNSSGMDEIDAAIETGRMGMMGDEVVRLRLTTKRGRMTVAYLTEQERVDLIKSLLRKEDCEWVIGLPPATWEKNKR